MMHRKEKDREQGKSRRTGGKRSPSGKTKKRGKDLEPSLKGKAITTTVWEAESGKKKKKSCQGMGLNRGLQSKSLREKNTGVPLERFKRRERRMRDFEKRGSLGSKRTKGTKRGPPEKKKIERPVKPTERAKKTGEEWIKNLV